jgi:hypothetical protein
MVQQYLYASSGLTKSCAECSVEKNDLVTRFASQHHQSHPFHVIGPSLGFDDCKCAVQPQDELKIHGTSEVGVFRFGLF